MSAICGVCYFQKPPDSHVEAERMFFELGQHRFDASQSVHTENSFFGCHLLHIVPESVCEVLPYTDTETSLVITADAIIDNRKELFNLLAIPAQDQHMPDSLLILAAYKKWGTGCPERLTGDFAFAIWDQEKQQLFCARDQVGKRTFYYYHSHHIMAFCTLIKPLFQLSFIKKQLNDVFVADFLALPKVAGEVDPTITIYQDVYPLPPGHAMLVNKKGKKSWQYWEIENKTPVRYKTDEEYEEAFRELFIEAVRCRLRSVKPVGIFLSGGLDSASVAAIAAGLSTKTIYSFTHVPMEGYLNWLPEKRIADESQFVNELTAARKGIAPAFVKAEGISPYDEINAIIKSLELPYKFFGNSYWVNEILRRASAQGIGVMLDGQSGNATVSWGKWDAYNRDLLSRLQLTEYVKEKKLQSQKRNLSMKSLIKKDLYQYIPYGIRKHRHIAGGGENYYETLSPINERFMGEMKVEDRFAQLGVDPFFLNRGGSFAQRTSLMNTAGLSNLGNIETKIPLDLGLVRRDPTRDKRLIEFCMNIPGNQWVREGNERRLIRRAMHGYLPDMIRCNTTVRGSQGADWLQRIAPQWQQISAEIATIGTSGLEQKYLNINKIKSVLQENQVLQVDKARNTEIKMLIRALIFARFLRAEFGNE